MWRRFGWGMFMGMIDGGLLVCGIHWEGGEVHLFCIAMG
jgi:hypothetical protein